MDQWINVPQKEVKNEPYQVYVGLTAELHLLLLVAG